MFGEEVEGAVGDDVREVVGLVVAAVADPLPVPIHCVIVELAILHQPQPVVPARWHVAPFVLVQIFPNVRGTVAGILHVDGKGPWLVFLPEKSRPLFTAGRGRIPPLYPATVGIVRVHIVVVDVEAGEDGSPAGTADGRRHKPGRAALVGDLRPTRS